VPGPGSKINRVFWSVMLTARSIGRWLCKVNESVMVL
jgi:hypothetical protein